MQAVIRNAFKSSTVLLIAHRIASVQHTDRLIVMDGGRIVEEGVPSALSEDKSTVFYSMLQNQRIQSFTTVRRRPPFSENDKLL